jgi:hypothetical protein
VDHELIAYLDERFRRIEARLDTLDATADALRSEIHLVAEASLGLNDRFDRFRAEANLVLDQVRGSVESQTLSLDGRLRVMEGKGGGSNGDLLDPVRRILDRARLQARPSSD